MRRSTKRTVVIATLAAAVVIPLAAALIVPHVVNIDKYHKQIQAQLERRLGRKVSMTKMHLSLLPPSFRAENGIIAEDPRFHTGNPFATAEKLKVRVRFWPLLLKEVEIKSLELDRPRIELVKDEQGVWNFNTLGQQQNIAAPEKATAGQIDLDHLLITDGQVAITDQQRRQPRAVYDHVDLDVNDFAPDREFSLKVSTLLPGAVKQAVLLEGNAGPIRPDILKTFFDGRLHLDQVPTSAAAAFLNTPPLGPIDAVVTGEARLRNSDGKLDSKGTIRFDDLHIHNVKVGYPVTLDYDVSGGTGADVIRIRHADVKLGSTPATIEGWLDTRRTPSQIDVTLTTVNASIAETARLASAFGTVFVQGTDVAGQMNLNLQARGGVDHPRFNGRLDARDLVISNKELSQPVKVDAIELTLTADRVRSNDFVATSGSTRIFGNFTLSQYGTPNSSISGSLRAPNGRLEEILNVAKAAGISTANGVAGEGGVTFDVHAEGPAKDLGALSMAGKGKLQNATLKLPSLAKPVQIQHADLIFNQESTALHNMSLTAGQTNLQGTLTVKSFATPQVQFTLHADKMNVREMQEFFTPPPSESAHDGHEFWPRLPRVEAGAPNESNLLARITGGGTVTAGAIQYDDLILNDSRSTIALDHGVIRMNPISAEVYGGKQSGNITIDMRPAQPVYSVSLKTEKVDANKLISAVSSLKEILYGSLAANMNGTFSSNSAEAIARSMNGNLELNLTNGKLMNLDLLHALAEVGKFASLAGKANNFTNVIQLSSTFNVKDGVARISNLQAAIDGGAIAANGLVNLAEQSLDLHVMAVLNKTLSQQVGGSQIGGFMNTALANDQKELVLPIILTGTLQHPQVAPDLQQVAQMKLQNLLPTTSKPNEFTSSMLEGVLASKTQAETTGTQPTSSPRKVLRARSTRRSRQQTSRVMAAPAPKN